MKQLMRKPTIAILFIFSTFFRVSAEEGMLIPSLIAAFEDDMQAMGMKLSADDIYSVNHSSLKDAILHFGGGCTAELVSGQGLLLTNHHCGYSQVQSHSSLENDYLKNGFWAKSKAEELANPGLSATRIVRIDDVTEAVLFGTNGLDGDALAAKMSQNVNKLIADAIKNSKFSAEIKAFNYGNDYYMIVKETFLDVRLVGTPPNSIGKFGGDTDNWVWPRHTGDFSVFRVYSDAKNQPSEYSESNVPYTPLHFLPVSMKSRHEGDFTMVYGFPGSTEQHLCSEQLRYIMDQMRPAQIRMRDLSLSVINASMGSSDLLRIMYSSKQARIANAWKKWIGQLGGLKTVDALQIKHDREAHYLARAKGNADWYDKYGSVIDEMNALAKSNWKYDFDYNMYVEYAYVGPEVFSRTRAMAGIMENIVTIEENGELEDTRESLRAGAKGFFKNYDLATDKQIFILLTEEYVKQMGDDIPEILKNKSAEELAEAIYSKSIFTDEARFNAFVDKMKSKSFEKLIKKDVGFALWLELDAYFKEHTLPGVREYFGQMDALLKTYVAGKKEMFPEEKMWPDANSTMRITYGKLEGSAPHDGMLYTSHTTLDGIIAKNNTGNPDYELLPRMRELAAAKNYGPYAQDGELWVCFTGSNHTTGGNSGSPAIDGEGNLIGLNFDRTWESTMSDYMFDSDRCRNIMVDIRYVMWVMDVYSGAKHLVDEMTQVK